MRTGDESWAAPMLDVGVQTQESRGDTARSRIIGGSSSSASEVRATRAAASMPPAIAAMNIFYLFSALRDVYYNYLGRGENYILLRRSLEKKRPKAVAFVIAI